MKISFATLGYPDWSLVDICSRGGDYDGADFRGLQETIDITQLPAFTSVVAESRCQLQDAGLEGSRVSLSIRVCVSEKLEQNLEEARRSVAVARDLYCGRICVFVGGDSQVYSKEALADIAREIMEQILAFDGVGDLKWLFETHDEWIKTIECKLLLDGIPNTVLYELEYAEVMKDDWRYVRSGMGQLPLTAAMDLLKQNSCNGWIMFEHEKCWRSRWEASAEIFPVPTAWARQVIA